MKKNLKIIIPIFLIAILFIVIVFANISNNFNDTILKKLQVVVYNMENVIIYDEEEETSEKYLFDALNNSFNDLKIEAENGDYGAFITSINGIEQKDNYYWNYYVNDKYAEVGVSNYEIQDEDIITFKLEKF